MGMFDNVRCEYPLPDTPPKIQSDVFQTKSFGDGYIGGFMDDYTITKDGQLIFHKTAWEFVEEKDRPYYGKPEWDKNPFLQLAGSMKAVPLGDEVIEHHGIIHIYNTDSNHVWFEYEIKFTDGKVSDAKRLYKELG